MALPNVFFKNEMLYINHVFYGEICNSKNYEGSAEFDERCGIMFVKDASHRMNDETTLYHFAFKIIDDKRFFLAKINYGI